ncbi:MAG: hypothetical protein R2801_11095 [Chitinophagales bacterium]
MKLKLYILLLSFFVVTQLQAQKIYKSAQEKIPSKYLDYEILGTNKIGTVIHYFGDNNEHELAILDDKLNTVYRKEIPIQDKNISVDEFLLTDDNILLFYTVKESNREHFLKMQVIDQQLNLSKKAYIIDSVATDYNSDQNFYVRYSPDKSKIVCFTILSKKNNFFVRFNILNSNLNIIGRNVFTIQDKNNIYLKSFRLSNQGNVLAVFAHKNNWSSDEYDYEKFTTMVYNLQEKKIAEAEISGMHKSYKNLVTDVNLTEETAYIICGYKDYENKSDIGFYFKIINILTNETISEQYMALKEEDLKLSKTFDFKNWRDNVTTLKIKKVIPRSDGGFIFAAEGEMIYTSILQSGNSTFNNYNPYFSDPYVRYSNKYQFNDVLVYSINPNGTIDWQNTIVKSQVSENDKGWYSSFAFFEAQNAIKFLYNEDISSNGNFIDYTINPNGLYKRESLLNAHKEKLNLVTNKALQTDGNTIIIPSEEKRIRQFIKIVY